MFTHFRVQRDYKMPRNLGVTGNDGGLYRGIGLLSCVSKVFTKIPDEQVD